MKCPDCGSEMKPIPEMTLECSGCKCKYDGCPACDTVLKHKLDALTDADRGTTYHPEKYSLIQVKIKTGEYADPIKLLEDPRNKKCTALVVQPKPETKNPKEGGRK